MRIASWKTIEQYWTILNISSQNFHLDRLEQSCRGNEQMVGLKIAEHCWTILVLGRMPVWSAFVVPGSDIDWNCSRDLKGAPHNLSSGIVMAPHLHGLISPNPEFGGPLAVLFLILAFPNDFQLLWQEFRPRSLVPLLACKSVVKL